MKAYMNPRDRISKASYLLMEKMKRSVSEAVQDLVRTGHLKIDKRAMPGLVYVLMSVVESGYHSGQKDFMKTVDDVLGLTPEKKRDRIKRLLGLSGKK